MEEERWEHRRSFRETRRNRMRCEAPAGQAFSGILLLTIGVLFLLGNMGYLDVRYVFRNFWPLILIFLGVKMLALGPRTGGPQGVGLLWLALGAFFLLSNFNFISVAFRTIWPFFPMAIGALILWKFFVDKGEEENAHQVEDSPDGGEADSASRLVAHAAFSHIERRSNSQSFRGGNVSTFMGMCVVDLRGATPADGEAVMDVSSFLGGIEIKVPHDWTVVNRVSAFMGGIEDRTEAPRETSKRLVLRGSAFLGGIEVRN